MSDNVHKFPIPKSKRILNRRGKLSLSCIVSDRWFRFGDPHREAADLGTPIEIDVMTDFVGQDGEQTRKLCGLIVTVDQLRKLLNEIDKTD